MTAGAGRYRAVFLDGPRPPAARLLAATSIACLAALVADAPATPVLVVATGDDSDSRASVHALGSGAAAFVDEVAPELIVAHLDAVLRRPRSADPSPTSSNRTVFITGELDRSTVAHWIARALDEDDGRALVLDLSAVQFVDSSGLAALAQIRRTLAAKGVPITAAQLSPAVEPIFSRTGFDLVLGLDRSR
jgi:anti-sigma B factor antagonist